MNSDQRRNYNQYIERYAEPEARALLSVLLSKANLLPENRAFASIPLCREGDQIEGCLRSLRAAAAKTPAIVVFVVNSRFSADEVLKQDNQETLAFLYSQTVSTALTENLSFGSVTENLSMIIVDRTSPGLELPENQGVGLARKIGCDLATVMMCETPALDGFIRNTDGDARVAIDFFDPIPTGSAAAIYSFQHDAKDDGVNAVLQYEEYLHYYVRAMAAAGSSYAFHTIGSTIACSVMSYIACRGFPKRDAGEDFYLLNKLAKDGDIVMLKRSPITLVARDSDRVPFGTGAACRRIEGLVLNGGVYKVYHPDCFSLLKIWLDVVKSAMAKWFSKERDRQSSGEFVAGEWDGFCAAANDKFSQLPASLLIKLEAELSLRAGFASVLTKSNKPAVVAKHAQIWFDGFRTMRFLNMARDHCFGEVPATELSRLFVD